MHIKEIARAQPGTAKNMIKLQVTVERHNSDVFGMSSGNSILSFGSHSFIHSGKLWEGNVFLQAFVYSRGEGGPHVTITHHELDLIGAYPLLVTSGGAGYPFPQERSGGVPSRLK